MPENSRSPSPDLVPELLVTDLSASLRFWTELCGFEIAYDRPDEGFAYLTSGSAHLMLEKEGVGRNWVTDDLERPLGRGINFQIGVPSIYPLLDRLSAADWPLFMAREVKSYRAGDEHIEVVQFLVQDPDGYLIRFSARADGG